ncbi:hypothetical protein [Streptosporangium sp. NPDC049078]|uniref:hypothetical protein n=1 Tax=Streptosporangium sp. NPDC049078 TaxID=3155767 RepID=UPI00342F8322
MRELQRGLAQVQQTAATGRPLTEASKGWILRAMDSPDTELGPGDVHIYARSGRLWVRSQSGDIPLVEFQQGDAVSNPSYSLTNATPTYVQGQAQTVVATVDALYDSHVALLASLRAAGIIDI